MSFHLYTSNRLELLADKLAEVVSHPLPSPLMAETVVVQSPGMQQWISLQLARRLGIWANCRYPFPNTIINELFSAVIADIPDYDPFARELMTWRIMGMLPDCLDKPGFESIKNYLGDERGFLKTWQIARQIANIFDQYTVFRPDMICRWEAGDDDGWQAELWRLLSRGLPSVHRPALRKAFFEALRNTAHGTVAKLPPRISVFGISALPHFHTEIFAAISELTDVNLFLMNPSQEYWAEIRSEYEMDRTLRREASAAVSADELHFEKGNSLLASMGRLGRDFLGMIIDYNPDVYACFAAPENDSLLHAIQSDILAMVDRGAAHEEAAPRTAVAEDALRSDASLRIHSCHSPMREVEVLYDILLDLFNHDPDLEPRDILVMTPDIDTYAPFIRAIFESPSDESRRIPFSIADRHVQRESKTVGTFLALLDLMKGRFGAGRVLAVLECEDVLRRFNLQPQDMYLIHTWVRETRICWGIDG
ncbi:MAG: exodeoxyribonuclease V subunit gamma, partial [Proteobacteria bacterium]|nr:exodeoxyribonuclease V subunit gamma [Pseudomonadota bacterium]